MRAPTPCQQRPHTQTAPVLSTRARASPHPPTYRAHVTCHPFSRRFDRDYSGSIDASELQQAMSELGLKTDTEETARVMAKYDTDRSGTLELEEFGLLVHDLRRFRASAAHQATVEISPSIDTLKGLVAGEEFELRVAQDASMAELTVEQFDPVGSPCKFISLAASHPGVSVDGGAGALVESELLLTPLSQPVRLRVEVASPSAAGVAAGRHWAMALAALEGVRYEVRHTATGAIVFDGTLTAPSIHPLDHGGRLFVGEEYTLATLDGALFTASTNFTVAPRPSEVVLRGTLREAKLTVVFESASGKPLPSAIHYRVRSRRAPAGSKPLVDARTSPTKSRAASAALSSADAPLAAGSAGSVWRVEVAPPASNGGFLLHDQYLLEVDGDEHEGGVSGMSVEFVTGEPHTTVKVRLATRGKEAAMRIMWCGPALVGAGQRRGDGDDLSPEAYEPVHGAIPFRLVRKPASDGLGGGEAGGRVLLTAVKAKSPEPTEVGGPRAKKGQRVVYEGEEMLIVTDAASGWGPTTTPVVVPFGEARFDVSVHVARAGVAPQGGGLVSLRPASATVDWARTLPPPAGIGFVIARDDAGGGYGYDALGSAVGGYAALPEPSTIVATGHFDGGGRARFDDRLLQQGTPYRVHLAHAASYGLGYAAAPMAAIGVDSAAPAEPFSAQFMLPLSAYEDVTLELRRRTRDVRVVLPATPGGSLATSHAIRVVARHAAASSLIVAEATAGSTTGQRDGDAARSCLLRGALYVGEEYTIHAAAEPPFRVVVLPANTGEATQPQTVELRSGGATVPGAPPPPLVAAGASGWYDERPPASGAEYRAEEDARRMQAALKAGDRKVLLALLRSRPVAELQMLRGAYRRQCGRELTDDLGKRSFKVSNFEQMLVLSKAELDVRMLHEALDGRGTFELTPILEVFCTSTPASLLELAAAYRALEGAELLTVLQRRREAPEETSMQVTMQVVPLLVALLERAAEAMQKQKDGLAGVADDVTLLRSLPPHDLAGLFRILASRPRAHLAEMAAQYAQKYGEPLRAAVAARCNLRGPLGRAVALLLEPAEQYYAHKLHAALHGLRRTAELTGDLGLTTLGRSAGLFSGFERRQSQTAWTPHDDTLIRVIAARHGRDLSGVLRAYRSQYPQSVQADLSRRTSGKLRLALLEILDGVDPTGSVGAGPAQQPAPLFGSFPVAPAPPLPGYAAAGSYAQQPAYGGFQQGQPPQWQPQQPPQWQQPQQPPQWQQPQWQPQPQPQWQQPQPQPQWQQPQQQPQWQQPQQQLPQQWQGQQEPYGVPPLPGRGPAYDPNAFHLPSAPDPMRAPPALPPGSGQQLPLY